MGPHPWPSVRTRVALDFDAHQRELLRQSSEGITQLRATMAVGRVGFASVFIVLMTLMVWFAKRGVLDPLRELTSSAEGIAQGDFTAAHQTLRDDEIGVLFNSFAKMAQSIQARKSRTVASSSSKSICSRRAK